MEREVARVKATVMAVFLALSFGGCAGYAIGFRDGQVKIEPLSLRPLKTLRASPPLASGKTWILNRDYYRTEAAYLEAVRQMSSGNR